MNIKISAAQQRAIKKLRKEHGEAFEEEHGEEALELLDGILDNMTKSILKVESLDDALRVEHMLAYHYDEDVEESTPFSRSVDAVSSKLITAHDELQSEAEAEPDDEEEDDDESAEEEDEEEEEKEEPAPKPKRKRSKRASKVTTKKAPKKAAKKAPTGESEKETGWKDNGGFTLHQSVVEVEYDDGAATITLPEGYVWAVQGEDPRVRTTRNKHSAEDLLWDEDGYMTRRIGRHMRREDD